jgi:hypothetical protein
MKLELRTMDRLGLWFFTSEGKIMRLILLIVVLLLLFGGGGFFILR